VCLVVEFAVLWAGRRSAKGERRQSVELCEPRSRREKGTHLVQAKEVGPDLGQHLVLEQAETLVDRVVDGDPVAFPNELDPARAVVGERLIRERDLARPARDRLVLFDRGGDCARGDGLVL
jgi:hypothetical protein